MRTLTVALVLLLAAACGSSAAFYYFPPPFLNLVDFQEMTYVLGQAGYSSGLPDQGFAMPGPNTLDRPGAGMTGGTRFYQPDTLNHRVLGFASTPNTSNEDATFVIGQALVNTSASGNGAAQMNTPYALWATDTQLFVGDTGNNRVLVFHGLPVTFGSSATAALGQPGFGASGTGTTASTMDSPVGVCATASKLLVADRDNHRVLIWNSIPLAHGTPADLALGQADLTSGLANRGGAADGTTLNWPWGVWTDGTRVVVADAGNHRVLIWNSFPTTSGQAADLVLGQPDMTTVTSGLSDRKFNVPTDVTSNELQLFVADCENNRVLVWDAFPTASDTPADKVLGQGDFTHGTANDDDQDSLMDGTPSRRTMNSGGGFLFVRLDRRNLFVGDHRNNRVMIYRGN